MWQKTFSPSLHYGSGETITYLEVLDPEHIWMTTSERLVGESEGGGETDSYLGRIYFFDGDSWTRQYEVDGKCELLAEDIQHAWAWAENSIYFFDGQVWNPQYEASTYIDSVEAAGLYAWAIGLPESYFRSDVIDRAGDLPGAGDP